MELCGSKVKQLNNSKTTQLPRTPQPLRRRNNYTTKNIPVFSTTNLEVNLHIGVYEMQLWLMIRG